ncbi:MAG: hypothetical protein JXR07_20375 [Reichenbachiella sp.]
MTSPIQNRRSYLKNRLKKNFEIDTKNRTIILESSDLEDIKPPDRYYVRALLKTGYQCQLSLFS